MIDNNSPRILLIDDEPSIREPLTEYLTAQGFAVTAAASAAEARSVLRAQSIDLVVSDIMMPGEDGLSLTRHLRETSAIPVILLTARAEDTERTSPRAIAQPKNSTPTSRRSSSSSTGA